MLPLILATAVSAAKKSGNMNGDYVVASGGRFDVPWNDDYASKGHEYFDVYAPEIATHYGEVFWTDQGNIPIPQDIIDRFDGRVMAITGYEQDQVMVSPVGRPGENPADDVSVPINWAYNHHYMAWMTGKHSELRRVAAEPGDTEAHGAPTKNKLFPRSGPGAPPRNPAFEGTSIPTGQMFSEGNGGESRKSFHGYPEGFAQLIESPTSWHITPMQIDTRNRDCGATPADIHNCTPANHGFVPGPEPRQARYGLGIPGTGTNYSGVLECPCNSRYGGDPAYYPDAKTKIITHHYSAVGSGACAGGESVDSAAACFDAAQGFGIEGAIANKTVSDPALPRGCSVAASGPGGAATVTYNTAAAGKDGCAASASKVGSAKSGITGVELKLATESGVAGSSIMSRGPKGQWCADNKNGVLKSFRASGTDDAAYAKALGACEAFCRTQPSCNFCSVDNVDPPKRDMQWNAIPTCGTVNSWAGALPGDISQKKDGGNVTITLSGPADVWFAVGLNAAVMSDKPYTLIVNSSGVTEQKLGTCGSEADHCPGDQLKSTVNVVSNTVSNGVRTVIMTRDLAGATGDHYTFSPDATPTILYISAIGASQTFAYHKKHDAGVIALLSTGTSTCICDTGKDGELCETDGTGCRKFVKGCVAAPNGDLLSTANPTCNSRQYGGGLSCCGHKRIMLDADQEIRPELLRYHMKFRFWFQEYKPATNTTNASHHDLPRIYYQTEANAGEYDIPPAFAKEGAPIPGYPNYPLDKPTPGTSCTGTCPDGPDCNCVHTIHLNWTVSNMRLIYAGGHCHAPACISIELYRRFNDSYSELLCRQLPKWGEGNVQEDKYDEAGYLALPPCLWSDTDPVLDNTTWLGPNTQLFSIKRNVNTHMGHYGEMASWQMRGVFF